MSEIESIIEKRKPRLPKFTLIALALICVGVILRWVSSDTALICIWIIGVGWAIKKMDERDSRIQGPQPRTSVLAISSPIISLVVFLGWYLCQWLTVRNEVRGYIMPYLLTIMLSITPLLVVAPIMGIWAAIKIVKSRGLLKGYIFAMLGIIMPLFVCSWGMITLAGTRAEGGKYATCQVHLSELGKGIRAYSVDNDNEYPAADRWCDLLIDGSYISQEGVLKCPSAKKGLCNYAINPNASANSPNDLVLLFETKGGWNGFGGPELMSIENHCNYKRGCNVLFNDGRVEFIAPVEFDSLKW